VKVGKETSIEGFIALALPERTVLEIGIIGGGTS
jgi:hypothetical protein